jgi:serine/threonine protein kinase
VAATRDIIKSFQQPAQIVQNLDSAQSSALGLSVAVTIPYEQIKLGNYINSGFSANVYEGVLAGQRVAVKRLKGRSQEEVAAFLKESEILKEVSSYAFCGVIKYHGLSICPDPLSYNIVTEFASGREIFEMISEFASGNDVLPLDITYKILNKTTFACAQLHQKSYVHSDLNWSNVLFGDDDEIKIADFGLSIKLNNEPYKIVKCQGSPGFIAPEVINKAMISPAADVYALGSMIYQISVGSSPFLGSTTAELLTKVGRGESQIIPLSCPYQLSELISLCWRFDPAQRPSAQFLHERIVALEKNNSLDCKA